MKLQRLCALAFCFITTASAMTPAPTGEQLIDAAREGDIEKIKKYIAAGGDINAKHCGYPALVSAVLYGHESVFMSS